MGPLVLSWCLPGCCSGLGAAQGVGGQAQLSCCSSFCALRGWPWVQMLLWESWSWDQTHFLWFLIRELNFWWNGEPGSILSLLAVGAAGSHCGSVGTGEVCPAPGTAPAWDPSLGNAVGCSLRGAAWFLPCPCSGAAAALLHPLRNQFGTPSSVLVSHWIPLYFHSEWDLPQMHFLGSQQPLTIFSMYFSESKSHFPTLKTFSPSLYSWLIKTFN